MHVSACTKAAQNWLAIFQGLASDFMDYRQCFQFGADDYGKQQKHDTRCFRHHSTSSAYIVKLPVHVARFTQKCISVLEACGVTEIQMQVYYYWLLGYELLVILACFNIFDSCWLYACGKALSNRL